MSKDNFLFAGGLVLIVILLATVFLWINRGQQEDKRQTGEIKNSYLIGLPDDATAPATQAATATQPNSSSRK